jgi:hypothetical protein
VRRSEYEPDELEFLSFEEGNDSWASGFEQGRTEVLDTLLPSVIEKVDAVLADEDADLPDSVLDLLEMLDRWIDLYRKTSTD